MGPGYNNALPHARPCAMVAICASWCLASVLFWQKNMKWMCLPGFSSSGCVLFEGFLQSRFGFGGLLCPPASKMGVYRFAICEEGYEKWVGGGSRRWPRTQRGRCTEEKTIFVIAKYIEDVKQDEKTFRILWNR